MFLEEQAGALAEAIPKFFEHELSETIRLFEEKVHVTLFLPARAEELAKSVCQKATELFDIPHYPAQGSEVFKMQQKPYRVTHHWHTT